MHLTLSSIKKDENEKPTVRQKCGLPGVRRAVLQLEISRRSVTGEALGVKPPHQHRHGLLAPHQGVLCVIELGVDVFLRAVSSAGCEGSSRNDG